MLILPISHERDRVRRYPWVTLGLIVACLVTHVWVVSESAFEVEDPLERIRKAQEYFIDHPHVDLPPGAEEAIFPAFEEETRQGLIEMYRRSRSPSRNAVVRKKHQEEFDALVERAREAVHGPLDKLYRRWGLVPASPSAASFLTHMFLHVDLLHLLGNLFLLYVTGPFVEDVWGRPLYTGFYLASGLAAASTFMLHHPGLDLPLIGASGAISGVMGAFFVRYWKTRVRFYYSTGFLLEGTFTAPAWLMLPLWLLSQFFMASVSESSITKGGVAYWAHIGGLLFGAGVAWLMKWQRIEERFLRPVLGPGVDEPLVENRVVDRAMEAHAAGAGDEALALLAAELERDPANGDVALALWNVAFERGRTEEAAPALLGLIRQELRGGQVDLAVEHWLELTDQVPDVKADPMLCVRLARALSESGNREQAGSTLRHALSAGGAALPASLALRIAREASTLDPQLALGAVRLSLSRPDLTREERAAAEELLRKLQPRAAAPVEVG